MNRLNIVIGYVICAALMLLGVKSMLSNQDAALSEAQVELSEGRTLLLSTATSPDSLMKFLMDGGYMIDPYDASVTSGWICMKIRENGGIENLGQLNTPAFKMLADTALKHGGRLMKSRVEADYVKLGMDEEWNNRPANLQNTFGDPSLGGHIVVRVANRKTNPEMPLSGISVRLRQYSYDTVATAGEKEAGSKLELVTKTLGYAVTDGQGVARFNVEPGKSYSVLPIAPGCQYGQEKGTTSGPLEGTLDLSFRQSPHVLSPLDNSTYQMLKSDHVLIVRSPESYTQSVYTGLAIFLVGWALMFVFMIWRDGRMHTSTDYLLLLMIMALTGIGLLGSYAMTSPLTDKPNGFVMAKALAIGLVAMAAVSSINFAKFYNGKSRIQLGVIPFDPIETFVTSKFRRNDSLRKRSGLSFSSGFFYLAVALVLIACLAMFGTGPEGSDARVNLGSFQPSELSKYLIVIFIAAFFAENALLLQAFSERLTGFTFRRQLATIAVVTVVMLVLMLIYLKVLSDMGPALVLLVTFIMIYSMARRDFAQLLLGLFTFIAFLFVAKIAGFPPVFGAAAWFVVWIAYGWFRHHKVYESAIFLNLLIVVFLFGAQILTALGADSEAARLTNRTDMAWSGVWNNTVTGGDQVAQGLWSVSSGGLTGMGLGDGSPSLVPACHTDMAFTSIGEMLGFAGLLLVIICFVLVVHRSLLIGRKAGHPFVMYLVMGIAIVTGVQFLFIVMGSLGLVPLTGISVPFLSYGRTGIIITMAMFGVVVSASRLKATESQAAHARTYDNAIAAGALLFMAGGVVILATLLKYQLFDKNETLIRPAFITNTLGERVVEYNPRINLILNRMHSGNIYDRNGVLLATSSRDELLKAKEQLLAAGLTEEQIQAEASKRRRRYYPFGNETLFMIGDANTKKVYYNSVENPTGYIAESRHLGELRGIDIRDSVVVMESDKYRVNRFMPASNATFKRTMHDYSVMLPFLGYGIERNPVIDEHNDSRQQRDLYLTIDALLQKRLQDTLRQVLITDSRLGSCPNLRASVVVLDASKGDLLCSANYPLPEQDSIVMLQDMRIFRSNPAEALGNNHAPITERDLGLTFQSQPGSTAKVMSAMAGLMANPEAWRYPMTVMGRERIEGGGEPQGDVMMSDAIKLSSNNFFINLVNLNHLYPQLESLYSTVGARVHPVNSTNTYTPYFFFRNERQASPLLHEMMDQVAKESYNVFDRVYMKERQTDKTRRKDFRWNMVETGFPWGQGGLLATPMNMARVVSIVANGGSLVPTRYVLRQGEFDMPVLESVPVLDPGAAAHLRSFMQLESDKHRAKGYGSALPLANVSSERMGGKTGTPERYDKRSPFGKNEANDGWYICFINSAKQQAPLAIAVRLERLIDYDKRTRYLSPEAVRIVADLVIPVLNSMGYEVH